MFTRTGCTSGAHAADALFAARAATRDDETLLAAALGAATGDAAPPRGTRFRAVSSLSAHDTRRQVTRLAAEIVRNVEARLPGRVSGLRVAVAGDQFALHGVSSSYYVKQVAGHIAMTTIDVRLAGRLANEIEVRSIR